MFVDSHAHLFYPNFDGELDSVLERAKSAGVDYIIVPATNLETCSNVIELTQKYEMIYGTIGVHPHDTKDWSKDLLIKLEDFAKQKKIVGIGEIGLDYYYDFSPKEKQIEAFKSQIELALKLNLPVVVHNRDASEDLLNIIKQYAGTGLRAQFHCFNGSLAEARDLIRMHHFISFTGNITFTKADALREIASKITPEHLLLETDSPFMTPVPFRGKRNEPAYVKLVAEKLAEIRHLTVKDIARVTSYNAFRMFGIGSKPDTSYTYQIGKNLYINVTNRCNADCVFCDRKGEAVVSGYNLKMNKNDEPSADIYIKEIGDPKAYNEIVFCGFGEPTIRWDVVQKIAKYVKRNGGRTRLDTNGHGSHINKRNISPELGGLIDVVSISLNAADSKKYSELMKVEPQLFNEVINFAKEAKNYVERVIVSAVLLDDIEIEKVRQIVEQKIGAEFRGREYF
ncbi:MAG: YchF/TatD family DNA exonuclease [Ignavibacteriaceae bacterium]|nr:YchF/TatD family DNA exonuclease [Ignavibacteriaceae bacterium]